MMARAALVLAAALVLTGCERRGEADDTAKAARLVTLGGTVTEIAYALGAGELVVGVDTSSTYPDAVAELPTVGYQRGFSAEGVLSLAPTVVLATQEAGPPAALEQLRSAGVQVTIVDTGHDAAATAAAIRQIAGVLNRRDRGEALVAELERELDAARRAIAGRAGPPPRVLFVYARGSRVLSASGTGTAADAMIRLAGGENAITAFEGFRPLTAEAVVDAAPEILLLPERGAQSLGGPDAVFALPGVAETPAGRARRLVTMDDLLLLGFGPRLGEAVAQLGDALASPEVAR